jgi:hypothetical protein
MWCATIVQTLSFNYNFEFYKIFMQFLNFLYVTTYFYIYPRIMGAKNVDYEFYNFFT